MYPELTPILVTLAGVAAGWVLFVAVRRPVLRRLALRQLSRRGTEAILVVAGSVLGTALLVSSLSVGDSLQASIESSAVEVLGPIDERVTSVEPALGDDVAARLAPLTGDALVDGVLTARSDFASLVYDGRAGTTAEPSAIVWDLDLEQATRFGGQASGLSGPNPGAGEIVVNRVLADRLGVEPGATVELHLYGRRIDVRVARIVAGEGLPSMGLGASENANAFLPEGTLMRLSRTAANSARPLTTTFVSNAGGVIAGEELTDQVAALIDDALGPLAASTTVIEAKREALDSAEESGDIFGALFLFISSFSIIAGVLLLVNVFVMLAEERKAQLGMLRACGLTRRRLVGAFAIEGAVYSLAACAVGVLVGIGVGRAVVLAAERIFQGFEQRGEDINFTFAVTRTSLLNAVLAGFLIALVSIVLTSVRISRLNIIAAIRDLPAAGIRGLKRRWFVVSGIACTALTLQSIPVLVQGEGAAVFVIPALALLASTPLLLRRLPSRWVWNAVGMALLAWGLLANVVRSGIYDSGGTNTYIALGVIVTFSAVLLVSQNQELVLRPIRRLLERPSETGCASRLAAAYPTNRRFRTGVTLAMYSLIVFVVVLLTQITAVMDASMSGAVRDASAGWSLRADVNPSAPMNAATLTDGRFAGQITEATPLAMASARATKPYPAGGTPSGDDDELPARAFAATPAFLEHQLVFDERLEGLDDDTAVWQALLDNPDYVVVDPWFGHTGGPATDTYGVGDTIDFTDEVSGRTETKTIVGLLESSFAFYAVGVGEFRYPALLGPEAMRDLFGGEAVVASYLLATAPGVDETALTAELQGEFISAGLVALSIREEVERQFAANKAFFRLMQGFLALGLVVGITGLGVVMVRAVRERRRTIGVLRALGFRARTVERAFMAESSLVALEGIIVGAVLAVLTTWILYQNSTAFGETTGGYPIAWLDLAVILLATFGASVLATLGPARRASRIKPAIAVRVAD